MSLMRFDPFADLSSLRRSMDHLLDEFYATRRAPALGTRMMGMGWEPAVEMSETENEVLVKAELPNIDSKNININITNDTITIQGETRSEHEDKGRIYHHREVRYGAFTRTLELPTEVKGEEAKAVYKDGVLEITIPKSERVKPTTVKVQVA